MKDQKMWPISLETVLKAAEEHETPEAVRKVIESFANAVNDEAWPTNDDLPTTDILELHLGLSDIGCALETQVIMISKLHPGMALTAVQLMASITSMGSKSKRFPEIFGRIKSKPWAAFAAALWFCQKTGVLSSKVLSEPHSIMVRYPNQTFDEAMQVYQAGRETFEEWLEGIAKFKWSLSYPTLEKCRIEIGLEPTKAEKK